MDDSDSHFSDSRFPDTELLLRFKRALMEGAIAIAESRTIIADSQELRRHRGKDGRSILRASCPAR